jgi:hypothetical protein
MSSNPVVIMNIHPLFCVLCDEVGRSVNLTRILKIIAELFRVEMHQISCP